MDPAGHFGLCSNCRQELPWNRWQCRQCALPLAFASDRMICGECLRDPPPFDRVVAPWHYRFPVDRMIQRYKDSGQRAFAKPLLHNLSQVVSDSLEDQPLWQPDLLIPAPMHARRRRQRGFNQASDIAQHLSSELGIPWNCEVLARTRQGPAQRTLDRQSRLANLKGAFQVTGQPPARVAVVDDVVTTGATARQLARTLKRAGAEEVQIWALARTPG